MSLRQIAALSGAKLAMVCRGERHCLFLAVPPRRAWADAGQLEYIGAVLPPAAPPGNRTKEMMQPCPLCRHVVISLVPQLQHRKEGHPSWAERQRERKEKRCLSERT